MVRWRYEDASSDLGHPSVSLRWTTLWDKTLFFKKKNDLAHARISNASLYISCVRDTAAKLSFLATISHYVKFLKGYSFNIGGYN